MSIRTITPAEYMRLWTDLVQTVLRIEKGTAEPLIREAGDAVSAAIDHEMDIQGITVDAGYIG